MQGIEVTDKEPNGRIVFEEYVRSVEGRNQEVLLSVESSFSRHVCSQAIAEEFS
jgi:hypothetical protein